MFRAKRGFADRQGHVVGIYNVLAILDRPNMTSYNNKFYSRLPQFDMAVNLLGVMLLLGAAAAATCPPTYDEPHRLETAQLLQDNGLTISFLQKMPHAPGPLTPIVQVLLAPLTHLSPPGIRLTNVALLGVTLAAIYLFLRRASARNPLSTSLAMMSLPATWVVAGLALSEMPAMSCIAISLCALQYATSVHRGWRNYVASGVAGTLLALAILGRQPYLMVVPSVLLLAICGRRDEIISFGITAICALTPPLLVFAVWGGVTPPLAAGVGNGVSIAHGILAYGYAGAFALILAPGWLAQLSLPISIIAIGACAALNFSFGFVKVLPLATIANQIIPSTLLPIYESGSGTFMLGLAVWFVVSVVEFCWARRTDKFAVFISVAVILVLATSFTITANFSSRYVAMCFPMLILMIRDERIDATLPFRSAAGNLLGFVSLFSYLGSA